MIKFKVKDEITWNELKVKLSGFAFFRKDENWFWVMMPNSEISQLLKSEKKIFRQD